MKARPARISRQEVAWEITSPKNNWLPSLIFIHSVLLNGARLVHIHLNNFHFDLARSRRRREREKKGRVRRCWWLGSEK
jgi:hypothetical protein